MTIRPLGARVLVKRLVTEERTTESGLVIPNRSQAPTYYNEVLAVGDEITKDISVGDKVLVTQFVGDEIRINQESHFIVAEADILAVICLEDECQTNC